MRGEGMAGGECVGLIVMLRMNLNFIQSLPEDLANENYELKGQLQQAKQKLFDFESRLSEAITCIAPNKPLQQSAAQILQQLVQLAKHQHSQLKSTQHCAEVLRSGQEELQRQQISQAKAIAQRDIEIAAQRQYGQEQAHRQAQRQRQLEEEIERLQQCNGQLVGQLQQLKIEQISNQPAFPGGSLAGQLGQLQSTLRSELVRAVVQRQQIENKLQLKAREVVRSEKDKQAMEQYYDQKWNSEYKKVKIKLEQTYNLKIAQLEEQSRLRLLTIQNELRELQLEKTFYLERNQQLEYRFSLDQKEKETLAVTIAQLHSRIHDFKARSVENSLMFREEIRMIKVVYSEEKVSLAAKINKLGGAIESLKAELVECRVRHVGELGELKRLHQKSLSKQARQFQIEKGELVSRHRAEVEQIKNDIYQQLDNAQIIKNQAERQFQSALQRLRADHDRAIALKEQEFKSNNRRWIDKHCELENLLSINRRKFEQEMHRKAEEIERLIEKQYILHREIDSLKGSIARLEGQVCELETTLSQKNALISEKQGSIASLSRDLTHSMQQIEILMNNRKQWMNQLLQVGREFKQSFDELKRTHEKQAGLFRSRVAELQEINSKNLSNSRQVKMQMQPFKHERQLYKPEIHIREAENLILHKVKDYYESKLREEGDIAKTTFKNSHAILARKLKKNRAYVNEVSSHRVFEPKETAASKTRYSNSVQKNYNLSLSRGKFKEGFEKLRVQTMSSFK